MTAGNIEGMELEEREQPSAGAHHLHETLVPILETADAIVYARPFISNPDLVERFRLDAPLTPWDVRTFYGGDDHGYTDYPTLAQQGWSGRVSY